MALSALFLLAGCSDPTDPCDREGACEVEGVDLVVDAPELVSWTNQWIDAEDVPLVAPGDTVVVRYRVWNRGSARSAPAQLLVCLLQSTWEGTCGTDREESAAIDLPALAPGLDATGELRLEVLTSGRIEARIVGDVPDAASENDAAASPIWKLAVPVLTGELVSPDTVREGVPFTAMLTIENASPVVALPDTVLVFCFADYDAPGCDHRPWDETWRRMGRNLLVLPFPALGPGERRTLEVELAATREWFGTAGVDQPWTEKVLSATVPRFDPIYTNAERVVLPNLDFHCTTRAVAPDTTVTGATAVDEACGLYGVGNDTEILTLSGAAGAAVRVELVAAERASATVSIVGHDGQNHAEPTTSPIAFTFPDAEPVHVVVANAGVYTLEIRRESGQ